MTSHADTVFKIAEWNEQTVSEQPDGGKITRVHVKKTYSGEVAGEGVVEFLMSHKAGGRRCFMPSELAAAWWESNAKNLMLLEAIPDDALAARYAPRTRTVAAQFAHMHNVRVAHLERLVPKRVGKLKIFGRGVQPTKAKLQTALSASAKAIAEFLAQSEADGKVKGWRGRPTTYLSYFVAHEAHHRGLTLVALRANGTKLPKEITYGIWYWRERVKKR